MTNSMTWILFLLSLSLESVYDEGIEIPRNTLTPIGERVILKCCPHNTNSRVTWSKYIDGLRQKICEGEVCRGSNNYKIRKVPQGCSDLIIESVSVNDSALYECKDGADYKAAAYVIAYNCSDNISNVDDLVEGDIVTFRCEVMLKNTEEIRFIANWKNENGMIVHRAHVAEEQNQYVSTRTITLQRPPLKAYTCVLEVQISPAPDNNIDTSTPIIANWISKYENVAYPVSNIFASCLDNACEKKVGDSITCSGDGYPRPNFSWFNEGGVQVSHGSTLKLTFAGEQKYKCVSTNSVRGTQHTVSVSIKVFVRETERSSYSEYATYYIAFIVTLIFIFLIYISRKKIKAAWRKIVKVDERNPVDENPNSNRPSNSDTYQQGHGLQNVVNSEEYSLLKESVEVQPVGIRPDFDDDKDADKEEEQ